jgi:hypothetical protein
MLDREQDKAINEARTARIPGFNTVDPQDKEDYVSAVVAKHGPVLIDRLEGTHPEHERDVIAGEIIRWSRTLNLDHLDDIQTVMYNHIRQVLARAQDLDKPNIVADPLSRSAHLR